MSIEEVCAALDAPVGGLTKPEAAARLVRYGKNMMSRGASRTLAHILWDQVYNIIFAILGVAAIIAGVFEEWIELGFIVAVMVANVIIGAVQEGRAEAATKAITAMVSAAAVVERNGRRQTVDAATLVPGDVVIVAAGDRLAADVRWLEASSLQVAEAVLTGESTPVTKSVDAVVPDAPLGDRTSLGFCGTLVFTGSGKGMVVATGDSAQIGKINTLMTTVEAAKTPLLVQVEGFGRGLSILCILVALITLAVSRAGYGREWSDALASAISVAVALIPEGLPTVVTITLALGVQNMAAARTIIRQLPAVETLGALTVICSDKTGTLTKNEMTAVAIHAPGGLYRVTGAGYNPDGDVKVGEDPLPAEARATMRQLLLPAALCNDATLMPLVSAAAQHMLATQAIMLPAAQVGMTPEAVAAAALSSAIAPPGSVAVAVSSSTGATNAAAGTGAGAPHMLTVQSHTVGSAIARALTVGSRTVEWNMTGDPTEAALLALAMKAGLNLRTLTMLWHAAPRVACLPFSSENKFMAAVHDLVHPVTGTRHRILLAKGAPDVLLPRCSRQAADGSPWASEPINVARWSTAAAELSREGMRVLALCWRELPLPAAAASRRVDEEVVEEVLHSSEVLEGAPSMQLNALVAIVDPPRDEVVPAIRRCHGAGVTVKMITGDHRDTAQTIGGWIGIDTAEVLTGPQLEAMDDTQLAARVEGCNIYARASPEHKLRIVKALQGHGHVVAMTGDGVNDAPALRQANVGVAMGITGTEVAKEAARMILLDDNFATLEAAVAQGRRTYDNLRKLVMFLLPTSVAQGISIAVAVFAGIDPPLNAVQILYVNMITAATLGLVLAAEEAEPDVMSRPPRVQGKPLVGKLIAWRSLFVGATMIVAMLLQKKWTLDLGGSNRAGNTIAMNTLVLAQCLYCLACRSMGRTALSLQALYTNPWLTSMVLLNAALQCLITYAPGVQDVFETASLNGYDWLRTLAWALAIFLAVEAEKAFGPRYIRPWVMPIVRRVSVLCICWRTVRRPAAFVLHAADDTTDATAPPPPPPPPVVAVPADVRLEVPKAV